MSKDVEGFFFIWQHSKFDLDLKTQPWFAFFTLVGNRDCIGKSLGNTEAEAERNEASLPGSTASSPDTEQPTTLRLAFLLKVQLFVPFHTYLPPLPKLISLNKVQAWERRAIDRFSSARGGLQRGEIPAGCRHDSGLIHQDCRKAVQIGSKWLD